MALKHQKITSYVRKVGESSHIYMPKTSISSRIQKYWKVPLRIFPLYGQIQGEVVVGTTLRIRGGERGWEKERRGRLEGYSYKGRGTESRKLQGRESVGD